MMDLDEQISENYKVLGFIDKGAYGMVYHAQHIPTGTQVAIKVQKLAQKNPQRQNHLIKLIREVQVLHKLSKMANNQFTVQLLDVFTNHEAYEEPSKLTKVYLVMEYINPSLKNLLDSQAQLNFD
jgi:serine/threonine protein kinase